MKQQISNYTNKQNKKIIPTETKQQLKNTSKMKIRKKKKKSQQNETKTKITTKTKKNPENFTPITKQLPPLLKTTKNKNKKHRNETQTKPNHPRNGAREPDTRERQRDLELARNDRGNDLLGPRRPARTSDRVQFG